MMKTIKITDDLILEIHDGDPPVLHLHNDDDSLVVIWPHEIRHLRDALVQAACVVTDIALGIKEPVTTATLNA